MVIEALAIAGSVLVGWYSILLGYTIVSRPRDLPAGPATMELVGERPAVVNLLTSRCRVTPASGSSSPPSSPG